MDSSAYPYVPALPSETKYKPLPTNSEEPTSYVEVSLPRGISEASILKNLRWTIFLCFFQLSLSTWDFFLGGNILSFLITALFILFGLAGVRHLKQGLIAIHFIYTTFSVFCGLFWVAYLVFYCMQCSLMGLMIDNFILLIQVLALRQERILLTSLSYLPALRAARELERQMDSLEKQEEEEKAPEVTQEKAVPPPFPIAPIAVPYPMMAPYAGVSVPEGVAPMGYPMAYYPVPYPSFSVPSTSPYPTEFVAPTYPPHQQF